MSKVKEEEEEEEEEGRDVLLAQIAQERVKTASLPGSKSTLWSKRQLGIFWSSLDYKTVRILRIQVRASSQTKVWNEAENRERDWGELRHALPISFTDFEKKTDCFAV